MPMDFRNPDLKLPIQIRRDEDQRDRSLLMRLWFGQMIAPPVERFSFHNFRTGKLIWLTREECEDRDIVADLLPQDAGVLAAFDALIAGGKTPIQAMCSVLGTFNFGPDVAPDTNPDG